MRFDSLATSWWLAYLIRYGSNNILMRQCRSLSLISFSQDLCMFGDIIKLWRPHLSQFSKDQAALKSKTQNTALATNTAKGPASVQTFSIDLKTVQLVLINDSGSVCTPLASLRISKMEGMLSNWSKAV